jgi:hypothetical protein
MIISVKHPKAKIDTTYCITALFKMLEKMGIDIELVKEETSKLNKIIRSEIYKSK